MPVRPDITGPFSRCEINPLLGHGQVQPPISFKEKQGDADESASDATSRSAKPQPAEILFAAVDPPFTNSASAGLKRHVPYHIPQQECP